MVKRRVFKLSGIILLVLLFFLAVKSYFKFIYYPNNPSSYHTYREREDYKPGFNNKISGTLEPPVGGCSDVCWGEELVKTCDSYSAKYDYCEVSCYGYVYNNCSSSKLGTILGLFTK